MTKEEWLSRCAVRYVERGGVDPERAKEFAQACFEAQDDGESAFSESADYNPEACADEDMSYWTDDGDDK